MTNMFTGIEQQADPIEAVKAKYNGNPDEAWKALAHAQRHISTLEAERKADAEKLAQGRTLDQALDEVRNMSVANPPQSQVPTSTPSQSVLDDKTLEQKLETFMREKAEKERIERAKAEVSSTLLRHYGTVDKAKEVMQAKAQELGMSMAALDAIGLNSPQALFKLFGIEAQASQRQLNASPTLGNVRTNMTETKPVDVYAPFREILKKDRNKAMSQEVQNEVMKKAFEQYGLKAYS